MYIGTKALSPKDTFEFRLTVGGVEQVLYERKTDNKIFVVARPGDVYQLHIRNRTDRRMEIITAVDGRNTLKDEDGDARNSVGLTADPFEIVTISGWRLNDEQTGEFVFGTPLHSIAAKLAEPRLANVGVIGVAVYCEQPRASHYDPTSLRNHAEYVMPPFSQLDSFGLSPEGPLKSGPHMMGGSVGTGIGAKQYDPIKRSTYRLPVNRGLGAKPETLIIGYDTEEVLERMGLLIPAEPDPFPGVPQNDTGYGAYQRS